MDNLCYQSGSHYPAFLLIPLLEDLSAENQPLLIHRPGLWIDIPAQSILPDFLDTYFKMEASVDLTGGHPVVL